MLTTERSLGTYGRFQVKEITKKIRPTDNPGLVRYNVYVDGDETSTPLLSFGKEPSKEEIRHALQVWFKTQDEFVAMVTTMRHNETDPKKLEGMKYDIEQRTKRVELVKLSLPILET